MKDIPGIVISAFNLGEMHIKASITLSFSDAKELCRKTDVDLPANQKFRELFFDKLASELQKAVNKKESKVKNVS